MPPTVGARDVDLGRRPAARGHRQGRHRQDDGGRGPGARARRGRPPGAARRGRGPAGHRPALRHPAAAVRGAQDRRRRPAAARSTRSPSTPRRRCWSTSRCSTTWAAPGRALQQDRRRSTSRRRSRPGMRDVLLTGKVKEAVAPPAHGRPLTCTTRWCWTRRRPAGSRASSTSTARSPGWPGSGPIRNQADGVMRLLHSPQTAVHLVTLLEEMPVRRPSTRVADLRAAGLPVGARHRQHGARAAAAAGRRWPGAAGGRARPGRRSRRRARRPARSCRRRRRGCSTRCSTRPPTTPSGSRSSSEERAGRSSSARPTYELPWLADGVDLGGAVRAGRRAARAGAHGADRAAGARRRPALDVDALLDDPATQIVVCCGSGGVGKTTTAAALALRAAERGRRVVRAHHRPGAPAGPVDGARPSSTTPRAAVPRRRRREAAARWTR